MIFFIKRIFFDFIVNCIAPSFWIPGILRSKLYKTAGINVSTNLIRRRCYINSKFLQIGEGVFINSYVKFFPATYKGGEIIIGRKCYIAMNALLTTLTHEVGKSECRAGTSMAQPIKIDDGCWIGANTTILPGVTIGKGCVIAAGAVVNKDCEPNGLYAGVPAKRIKDLPVEEAV